MGATWLFYPLDSSSLFFLDALFFFMKKLDILEIFRFFSQIILQAMVIALQYENGWVDKPRWRASLGSWSFSIHWLFLPINWLLVQLLLVFIKSKYYVLWRLFWNPSWFYPKIKIKHYKVSFNFNLKCPSKLEGKIVNRKTTSEKAIICKDDCKYIIWSCHLTLHWS